MWIPPLEGLVDKDDIVPDTLDAVPGDVELLPPAEQPEEATGAEDYDGHYLSLRHFHIHIPHKAQSAAIADVDDLFASQVLESALHGTHLSETAYAAERPSYAHKATKASSIGKIGNGNTVPRC